VPQIVTGEAVALELRLAQLPSRTVAAALDFAVMGLAYALLLIVTLQVMAPSDPAATTAAVYLMLVAVFLGYPLVLETVLRGRTLGKLAMGLRVVRADAGPITFRQALVRAVTGLVLERPGVLLLGSGPALAFLVMLFSGSGKRIGDMAAGTVVIQERIGTQPYFATYLPPPLVGWVAVLDLTALDDRLGLSIRQFLSRVDQLDPVAREVVGHQLLADVLSRISPPPPPGTPGWAVMSAVLAERRRREELRLQSATRSSSSIPSPATTTSPLR
jgi:uncharacterized RDD family membrane protein YckC